MGHSSWSISKIYLTSTYLFRSHTHLTSIPTVLLKIHPLSDQSRCSRKADKNVEGKKSSGKGNLCTSHPWVNGPLIKETKAGQAVRRVRVGTYPPKPHSALEVVIQEVGKLNYGVDVTLPAVASDEAISCGLVVDEPQDVQGAKNLRVEPRHKK